MADWLESFLSLRIHVLIRFGQWDRLLDLQIPKDEELYCVTTAMIQYGHGIALAATGNVKAAEEAQALFNEAVKRVKPSRTLFNNASLDILAIAREMLKGEIEYRKNNVDPAFEHLRKAIDLEDHLSYDEPWGWSTSCPSFSFPIFPVSHLRNVPSLPHCNTRSKINTRKVQPTRHALGALSLEQGAIAEAVQIYKADLGLDDTLQTAQRHLNNVWSLHGYHECLVKLGKEEEARDIKARLDEALKGADVEVGSSCFCRLGVGKSEEGKTDKVRGGVTVGDGCCEKE